MSNRQPRAVPVEVAADQPARRRKAHQPRRLPEPEDGLTDTQVLGHRLDKKPEVDTAHAGHRAADHRQGADDHPAVEKASLPSLYFAGDTLRCYRICLYARHPFSPVTPRCGADAREHKALILSMVSIPAR